MKHSIKLLAITAIGGMAFSFVHPASASTPALTQGMEAPTLDVGTGAVTKGTVQYSNSIGTSDSFSVGATTSVGASANASSTPDYSVSSNATLGISGSTINQQIGGWSTGPDPTVTDPTATTASDVIKGSFDKKNTVDQAGVTTGTTNTVEVNGIGTDAKVAATASNFTVDIVKGGATLPITPAIDGGEGMPPVDGGEETATAKASTSAGTANGGASGSIGTTASTSANNTSFVSSFAQAY